MKSGLLPGVRVLDIGQGISGPYCAMILANLGAEVIKVEPLDGDEARRMGRFPGDVPHPEKSGLFLSLNVNKRGVTLDLASPGDARHLLELVEAADIVVDNGPVGRLEELGLGYDAMRQANPEIILASITPFGDRGSFAKFLATDLVLFHMSGHAHNLLGPVEDPETTPPVRAGDHQAERVAGLSAATASLIALYRKRMTGLGCHVVVSSFEAMATQLISGLAGCAYGQPAPPRSLPQQRAAAAKGLGGAIGGVLPCTDGFVAISPREDAQWARLLEVMGNPEWSTDERYATRKARQANSEALWDLLGQWSKRYSKHEIARMGQERRIPCFPVNTVEDLLNSEQLEEREFFVEIDHRMAGRLMYPGVAYRLSDAELPLGGLPAPLLGEHNDSILSGNSKPT